MDPSLPPVNLDELERKICCCRLVFEADESNPVTPTPCHAPAPLGQPPDILHHPQPTSQTAVHPDLTIAPYTMHTPAKTLDPDALPHSVPKPLMKPSNHCKHRATPPSPLAPPPKRARITSYFSSHPGGSVPPSPSIPLPPFNPVLMHTPDKYTQQNFHPP